jgi:hypothetical protein
VSRKPIRPREIAYQDVQAALDYHVGEAGLESRWGSLPPCRRRTVQSPIIPPQAYHVTRTKSLFRQSGSVEFECRELAQPLGLNMRIFDGGLFVSFD